MLFLIAFKLNMVEFSPTDCVDRASSMKTGTKGTWTAKRVINLQQQQQLQQQQKLGVNHVTLWWIDNAVEFKLWIKQEEEKTTHTFTRHRPDSNQGSPVY